MTLPALDISSQEKEVAVTDMVPKITIKKEGILKNFASLCPIKMAMVIRAKVRNNPKIVVKSRETFDGVILIFFSLKNSALFVSLMSIANLV